jgi:hypothetical protein
VAVRVEASRSPPVKKKEVRARGKEATPTPAGVGQPELR